jgi:hypothetical protein
VCGASCIDSTMRVFDSTIDSIPHASTLAIVHGCINETAA